MIQPKVSVIVPVYNVEQYIHACVDSILGQTLTELELILINDGSQDKSGEICNDYSQKDNRVIVIHKKNGGPSSARNLGIRTARGEYIGFVDSDDTIDKEMYKSMYEVASKTKSEIIACGYTEINKFNGTEKYFNTPLNGNLYMEGRMTKNNLETLLINNKILGYTSLCNKLYKRSYILKTRLFINERIKIAEDECFNLIALSKANRISAINECFYKYRRINSESIMNKQDGKFYLHLEARGEIIKILKLINISNDVYLQCLRYENCKTVAAYLERIKIILISNEGIINKFKQINEIIHEHYFLDAIKNFNNVHLVFKAKVLSSILKKYLLLEKVVKL
jgi:glycosyltransferase involved in cell wall biosynthesis